jgi:hypothetical protein
LVYLFSFAWRFSPHFFGKRTHLCDVLFGLEKHNWPECRHRFFMLSGAVSMLFLPVATRIDIILGSAYRLPYYSFLHY